MRTLVDLIHTESGYARIFYGPDSYGYQLYAYRPEAVEDLFARMTGFESIEEACDAARHHLAAMHARPATKTRKSAKTGERAKRASRTSSRGRSDGGSMGLL